MELTKEEITAIVAAVRQANEDAAVGVERKNDLHCKVRWRRRMITVAVVVVGAYAIGEYTHIEAALKGWEVGLDGLVACAIDKLCFGIAEVE